MSLTKEQIKKLKSDVSFPVREEFSEEELREAVGITKTVKGLGEFTIGWSEVCNYIFYWFNKFSVDFKREAREKFIEETMRLEKMDREEATKEVNDCIACWIMSFIFSGLNSSSRKENYLTLQQIKEGKFYEFINID